MDDRWAQQAQQDNRQVEDQSWLVRTGLAKQSEKVPDPNDFPMGEPHWIVRNPALIVLPILAFGSCFFTLIMMWLSAGK